MERNDLMNKQELLNWIESSRTMIKKLDFTDVSDDDRADYLQTVTYKLFVEVEKLVNELNEPQKVKVPAFIAEWYEMNKSNLEFRIWKYIKNWDDQRWDDFKSWMDKNGNKSLETLTQMQYGYEVEEEPKYRLNIGGLYLREPLGDTNDFTIRMTWNEDYAYQFDSWNMAREHISELGGTIEKV